MPRVKKDIYQVKIQLEGVRPPIWRRILLSSGVTLSKFHDIIQLSMGWTDSHLHMFEKDGELFGPPDPYAFQSLSSERTKLSLLLRQQKEFLRYEYDFGDGWSHKVTLEKIMPFDASIPLPLCAKGTRSCPPEDCGGPWGYSHLLEVLSDPAHEEHDELSEWVGDYFSPEEFDLALVNELLREHCS